MACEILTQHIWNRIHGLPSQSWSSGSFFPKSGFWWYKCGVGAIRSHGNMKAWENIHMNTSNSRTDATAKSLQSNPTLCNPIDGSPPGSPIPGTLQARTLEWVAISSSNAWKRKVKGKSLSRVWLLATPWTTAYQAPPSVGLSRQEYWSRGPLPSLNSRTERRCRLLLYLSKGKNQGSLSKSEMD